MVYLIKTNLKDENGLMGYKIHNIATFKKIYPNIPEILIYQYGVPLDRKIWVLGMYWHGGYRTPFKCLFKGTLLEWFQKYFIRYNLYDEKFRYLRKRGKRSIPMQSWDDLTEVEEHL